MKRKNSPKITRTGSKVLRDLNFRMNLDRAVVGQIHNVELIIRHLNKTKSSLNERDRVALVNDARKSLSKIKASGEPGIEEAKILRAELKEAIS